MGSNETPSAENTTALLDSANAAAQQGQCGRSDADRGRRAARCSPVVGCSPVTVGADLPGVLPTRP
jgi:hypothetical protein